MKYMKHLLLCLWICLALPLSGCAGKDKSEVKEAVRSELDLLKNLDSQTTQEYITYSALFSDDSSEHASLDEINDVFTLFFKDFDYKIHSITLYKDKTAATASVDITTLDAEALAKDYAAARLQSEIEVEAESREEPTSALSEEEQYLLLNHVLKTNNYDTIKKQVDLTLVKLEDEWHLDHSYNTENNLVGGLITYLSDPDILSPEDTLSIYLDALKQMTLSEMSNYLGIESILDTEDTDKAAIAEALILQVQNNFNYEITDCEINGYHASVTTEITTFDSDAILSAYQKELESYLETADAVIDGSEVRQRKARKLLLDTIEANKDLTISQAVFHLTNDGVSWKLSDPSIELGNSIFGTLTTDPTSEEDSAEAVDSSESTDADDVDTAETE